MYVSYFIGFIKIEPFEGDSKGYSVKTMEEEFPISSYPLEQTEFLFYMKEGRFTKFQHSLCSIDLCVHSVIATFHAYESYDMMTHF